MVDSTEEGGILMNDLLKDTMEDEDSMKGRFLTFIVGKEAFGIEIKNVVEIIGIQSITEMPETPEYIKGIINLRGKIVPAMDVRLRFKIPSKEYDDRTCVIVVNISDISVGLIVDSVAEVMTIPSSDITDKPELGTKNSSGYIKNIGKTEDKVILLIDCEKLLTEPELEREFERELEQELKQELKAVSQKA